MTLRSRYALRGLQAGWLMATAGTFVGALPMALAADTIVAPSTLAPRLAPAKSDLDATISSMVRRGLLPDVRPAHTASRTATTPAEPSNGPAPQLIAAKPLSEGPSQWRPAGTGNLQNSQSAEEAFSEPAFPTLPGASSPATPDAAPSLPTDGQLTLPTLPSEASVEPQVAPDMQPEPRLAVNTPTHAPINLNGPSLSPAPADDEDEDDLAPIDELSETPAPDSDAPGDPSEPEYTGAAVADPQMPPAKPLSQAPKPSTATDNVALGEPDRYARPSDRVENPTDPKSFEENEEEAPQPRRALKPLTKNQMLLRNKVRQVLKQYYNRPLSAVDRSPWEVMHGMLAFEVHSRVLQGGPKNQPITAVGWLCFNQPCRERTLMYLNEDGDLRVKVGPALQGHHGQLLALLAQARVRSDYPLKVEGKDFTVADLIEVEKLTCYPKTELTFKLIGLQRYLNIEDTWVNDQGMQWDFPKLIAEEMAQPVRTAACGGTHRLAGLALAVKKRRASGLPVDGQYAAAQKFVANYQNYAYRLQNSDGSFSTDWFKGPGADPDIDRRLKTTGHQLELMLYAGSEAQLHDYRTVRAVNYLTNIMHANRTRDWEAGPLGHAVHALVLYDRLAFSPYDAAEPAVPVAQKPGAAQR